MSFVQTLPRLACKQQRLSNKIIPASATKQKQKESSKKNVLFGAHKISPKVFKSRAQSQEFFSRFQDISTFGSLMFSFTTITHKTSDTAHPLVMLTNREGARYFFGKVPEGTQRVLNENRFRLGKLKSIFLTGRQSNWTELGGLPGLFLTVSDSTKKSIDVFCGSPLLAYILATWRYFVFRKGVELKINDLKDGDVVSDSNINVTPIKVYNRLPNTETVLSDTRGIKKIISLMFPMDTSKVNSDDPMSYKSDPSESEIHTHVKLTEPNDICELANEPSTNYLLDFVPIRGKFDPKVAIQLGIKPGPDFRKLSEGISVANQAGELISPSQVVGESKTFPRVLIMDIPNETYRSRTLNRVSQAINEGDTSVASEPIKLAYHFLGDDVNFRHPEYASFIMDNFADDCTHVLSQKSSSIDTLVFKTASVNLLKLKSLQSDSFNLPSVQPRDIKIDLPYNSTRLSQLQQFNILSEGILLEEQPEEKSWDKLFDENVAPLNLNIDRTAALDKTPILLGTVEGTLKDQVQIMTLGTGSALPSLHRNVISTLVRIPTLESGTVKFRSILLDSGENTLGTMYRNFGHNNYEQLNQVFKELQVIYLSHLHADHHLGIMSIIKKWFEINNDDPTRKLYLVVPWQYNKFVEECIKLEELNSVVDFSRIAYISCEEFLSIEAKQFEFKQSSIEEFEKDFDSKNFNKKIPRVVTKFDDKVLRIIKDMYSTVGINSINTCRAIHCSWAYSVCIDFKCSPTESFKVSYSGDTRPNPKFADIGYGSDLLIHESSLAEDLIEEALAKKHSTMIEAVTMSKLMHCPKIILTHFSTRYSNRADLSVDPQHLTEIATKLKNYLTQHGVGFRNGNILLYDNEISPEIPTNRGTTTFTFNDLEICYAFDMMTIRYKDLILEKFNYNDMLKLFELEALQNHGSLELVESKRQQELERQKEKREAKRDQRLGKKKRRTSEESL